jgi:flagellar biosynthesis/type III secretory pathway ATPase
VLVEGDDMTEPIADETRSILDGHIVLSRKLAAQNHYPAIDINESVSRVMSAIAQNMHLESAGRLREVLATYEAQRDLILIGAYKKGSDPKTDYAISKIDAVNKFLKQATHEQMPAETAIQRLIQLF